MEYAVVDDHPDRLCVVEEVHHGQTDVEACDIAGQVARIDIPGPDSSPHPPGFGELNGSTFAAVELGGAHVAVTEIELRFPADEVVHGHVTHGPDQIIPLVCKPELRIVRPHLF
jgi:hypothetical protein